MKRKEQQKERKEAPHSNKPRNEKPVEQAHRQADKDIAHDPDLTFRHRNEDLDEGELARLGSGPNSLI
jgi:hypothetical protein